MACATSVKPGCCRLCARLCTPYNHAPVYSHFIHSHIRRIHVCFAVTCHLHFWQNDRDRLRAATVTRGMERIPVNKPQKDDPEEENSPAASAGPASNPRPFDHESGALATKLSPLVGWLKCCFTSTETVGFLGTGAQASTFIVQELCESRSGRPGLSVLTSLLVSVDVKTY